MKMTIVIATNNEHKVSEIREVLPPGITIRRLQDIGCTEELPETTGTIEGNSSQKARYVAEHYQVDCFAEDTGLEVDALNGAPGVDSAHYAGPERDNHKNIAKLLREMDGKTQRKAHFKTVITLIINNKEYQFTGILEGQIGLEARGTGGFGYDPVFELPDGRTLAELAASEKALISHRGKATAELVGFLKKKYLF